MCVHLDSFTNLIVFLNTDILQKHQFSSRVDFRRLTAERGSQMGKGHYQ